MGTDRDLNDEDRTTDVFWLVERIKGQLTEFGELRDRIRVNIESMVKLIPSLEEQKKNLQDTLEEERKKTAQIEVLVPKLKKQKEKLQEDIRKKKEMISQINSQLGFLSQAKTGKA